MRLKHYIHYALTEASEEDSPLYIFDSSFGCRRKRDRKRRRTSDGGAENRGSAADLVPEHTRITPDASTPIYISENPGSPCDDLSGKQQYQASTIPSIMFSEYQIPPYFEADLFSLTGGRRPPHRWIIMGPARSGSGIHIDPREYRQALKINPRFFN